MAHKAAVILRYLERSSWVALAPPLPVSLPAPDDEPLLEIAVSGGADYLVTGNAAPFPSELCQGIKVIAPVDFLKRGVKRQKGKKRRT